MPKIDTADASSANTQAHAPDFKVVTDIRAFFERIGLSGASDEGYDEYLEGQAKLIVEPDDRFLDSEGNSEFSDLALARHLTFEEANSGEDGVVAMEGDWGGQIYLTCQMKYIKCDEETLSQLLTDLDSLAWDCNEGDGAGIAYRRVKPGYGISGGMGGGIVVDGLWVHEEFQKIAPKIQRVLISEMKSIFNEGDIKTCPFGMSGDIQTCPLGIGCE